MIPSGKAGGKSDAKQRVLFSLRNSSPDLDGFGCGSFNEKRNHSTFPLPVAYTVQAMELASELLKVAQVLLVVECRAIMGMSSMVAPAMIIVWDAEFCPSCPQESASVKTPLVTRLKNIPSFDSWVTPSFVNDWKPAGI